MTLPADLDAWADDLALEVGLPVTRDPAKIYPPCLFLGMPSAATATLNGIALEVPVNLVGAYQGKQAGDQLLDNLVGFTQAMSNRGGTGPTAGDLTIGEVTYPAYTATARLYQSEDTPTPVEPAVPQAETTLPVDLYADAFIRVGSAGLTDDGQAHWVQFVLATTPGPGGSLTTINGIASRDGVAWFDLNGSLGHVIHAGADLPNITLSNYIHQGRLALVTVDSTNAAHPELVITDLFNPPNP